MQAVVKGKGLLSVMAFWLFTVLKERDSNIWGQLEEKTCFWEKQYTWVLQYSQLYIFGFLCVDVSGYTECKKQYPDNNRNDLLCVYVEVPLFPYQSGSRYNFNPSNFVLPTCNVGKLSLCRKMLRTHSPVTLKSKKTPGHHLKT